MASFRFSLLFIVAALIAVVSASGYKPTSCCVKTQKCCITLTKCGYIHKQVKHKVPLVHKVCGKKCDYKPHKYSKKVCTSKRVPVPCKHVALKTSVHDDDSYSDGGNGSDSGSDVALKTSVHADDSYSDGGNGSDSGSDVALKTSVHADDSDSDSGNGSDSGSDDSHKPPKPQPPKICYKTKKHCYPKWFTEKKKVCRDVCKKLKAYQFIFKVYKYPKYCPKVSCEKLKTKCTGKKLKAYVSKKGIYTKTIKGKKVVPGDKAEY